MRVLLTGATGFIGRHLVALLLKGPRDHEVLGVTRGQASDHAGIDRLSWVSCDLRVDRTGYAKLVRAWHPDVVCHLAAESSAAASDHVAVMAANVDATRCVYEASAALRPPPRTILASSGYVYGQCSLERPARESDATADPETMGAYALSKLRAEAVAAQFAEFAVIVRTFNCTGPGQAARFAIPGFCRSIALAERGELDSVGVGNLDTMRDLSDVRDVAEAFLHVIEQGRGGETYNIASGTAQTMRHYLNLLLGMSTARVSIVPSAGPPRVGDIGISVGDASKLRVLTGWTPRVPLERTLRETLEHWRGLSESGPLLATSTGVR